MMLMYHLWHWGSAGYFSGMKNECAGMKNECAGPNKRNGRFLGRQWDINKQVDQYSCRAVKTFTDLHLDFLHFCCWNRGIKLTVQIYYIYIKSIPQQHKNIVLSGKTRERLLPVSSMKYYSQCILMCVVWFLMGSNVKRSRFACLIYWISPISSIMKMSYCWKT